jgi:hypothetical protein
LTPIISVRSASVIILPKDGSDVRQQGLSIWLCHREGAAPTEKHLIHEDQPIRWSGNRLPKPEMTTTADRR